MQSHCTRPSLQLKMTAPLKANLWNLKQSFISVILRRLELPMQRTTDKVSVMVRECYEAICLLLADLESLVYWNEDE